LGFEGDPSYLCRKGKRKERTRRAEIRDEKKEKTAKGASSFERKGTVSPEVSMVVKEKKRKKKEGKGRDVVSEHHRRLRGGEKCG